MWGELKVFEGTYGMNPMELLGGEVGLEKTHFQVVVTFWNDLCRHQSCKDWPYSKTVLKLRFQLLSPPANLSISFLSLNGMNNSPFSL